MKDKTVKPSSLILLAGLIASLSTLGALGQETRTIPPSRGATVNALAPGEKPNVIRFDLDFPGGSPRDLVQAIENASGKPLNIVIPLAAADTPLPPLKMKGVTVPQLFAALQPASGQTVGIRTRVYGKQTFHEADQVVYKFDTVDTPIRDDSVWYFTSRTEPMQKSVQFWQLEPYLTDYTIDDITTAIQTGYKMLGDGPPTINFHKDTKLLIAVGEPSKLALIDAVLAQLVPARAPAVKVPAVPGTPAAPKP